MALVRRLTNTSQATVPVRLRGDVTLQLAPGAGLDNEDVKNLDEIRRFCHVVEDLTEVHPQGEKQYLRG